MSSGSNSRRRIAAVAGVAATALVLSACGGSSDSAGEDGVLTIGTSDKILTIDPAGSYDNGSFAVMNQVYPFLLNTPIGSADVKPDIAESAEFVEPTKYQVKLKAGLKFANGNDLTASDVKFSFDRQVAIAHDNGPASLLGNLASTEVVDDTTVVFNLKSGNDQTFPQILASPAGPIVDEQTYPADKALSDEEAVGVEGFSGPFTIGQYQKGQLAQFKKNADYDGAYNDAKTDTITLKTYTDSNNLKLDIEKKNIDVAWRSLTPTDIESLEGTDGVTVHKGAGGELRYIVFNLKTMPGKGEAQKQAIRQAAAYLVNRDEISSEVYKGTYTPAYSAVPDGQVGATEAFKDKYGQDSVIGDVTQAAYLGPWLWKAAVEKAGSFDIDKVVAATPGIELTTAPEGYVKVHENQHLWSKTRIGKVLADGQFEVVFESDLIEPNPFPKGYQ